MAQPNFISSIQDFVVGSRPIGTTIDHALLTFRVSLQFSTTLLTLASMRTRYTFTSETDSVYVDSMYRE